MKTRLVWIASPRGVSPAGLQLSVFVAMQLDTKPQASRTLNDFPAVRDWPAQALTLRVQFNNAPPATPTVAPKHADALALWQAMFPATLGVNDFAPKTFAGERMHSYPVSNVVGFLRQQYSRMGVMSAQEIPSLVDVALQGFGTIATALAVQTEPRDLTDRRRGELQELFGAHGGLVIPPLPPNPPMDFFRAVHFHRFKGGDRAVPVDKPTFDFHRGFTMLLDHPDLLRAVGVVLDLTVPLAGQPAAGVVRVIPAHDFQSHDLTPATSYTLDAANSVFLAAPVAGSLLSKGMLQVGGPPFELVQVDADGSALKAVEFANQVMLRAGSYLKSADSPTDAALPALRTGGLALVQTGRASAQHARFGQLQTIINSLTSQQALPDLSADDLVTGFLVDVEDKGVWRSLSRRRAVYRFVRISRDVTFEGEANVGAALVRDDRTPPAENYLHEALFHWDGWSLAVPRVGESIQEPQPGDPAPHQERLTNPSATDLALEITSTAIDGSLPRLRFGRTYRLRVRAADVAGNAVPHQSTNSSISSAPAVYKRFEPIEPPAVVLLSSEPLANLPGESVDRVVIRSRNAAEALDSVVSPELSERIVLPPRTSVTLIEQAGALDLADGTIDSSAETWERLATKDETLAPEIAAVPIAEVPFLSDPFATGVVFRRLPGSPAASFLPVSFEATTWWNAKPLRLALIEGAAAPDWDPVERVLTVGLPKGTMRKISVSSQLVASWLDRMALWEWFEAEAFDADDVQRLKTLALDGAHWMLTPPRELTLVHAVLQPLARPAIVDVRPTKSITGQTFAALAGRVNVHAPSTGRVDILASWSEWTGIGFATVPGGGHVCDVRVDDADAAAVSLAGQRHDFGDTKRRFVHYRATATTRFRDYFDPAETADTTALMRESIGTRQAEVLSSGRPAAPTPLYVVPTFEWQAGADETGRFARRLTGLRVYLEAPWFSSGEGELLGVVLLPFPGDGCAGGRQPATEQALDILRDFPRMVAPAMKSYVTQWARDPIWLSSAPQTLPSVDSFPRAVARGIGLSLVEIPPATTLPDGAQARVAVAGHEIGWDDGRGLFYCDLDVDAGRSYYPFIRLALARYQPGSIPETELSPVVLADFIQLAPERVAWIVRRPENRLRLKVALSGPAYRANASFLCTSRVQVRLERFLDETESDFKWVPISRDATDLVAVQALKDAAVWTGELELPPDRADARFRVIFEEYESYLGDRIEPPPPQGTFGVAFAERLVYADAVEV